MRQSKNILIISSEFPPGPGGIGNHGFNLANNLHLNGIDVKVLTVSDYVEKEAEENFDKKYDFEIVRFKRYKNRLKTYKERIDVILKTVSNGNFTHIIFSGRFSLLISLLLKKHKKKIKFIAIGHGAEINSNIQIEKILIDKALRGMDLIVPVSNFSKSKLPKSLHEEKIVVIPNGFDIENIKDIKVNEKAVVNGSLNLVTIGTVWPRKGQHNVVRALPEIAKNFPEVKYNVVGRLVDLSKIRKITGDKDLGERLKFHGPLPNEEMYKILNDSHIFLMLSESQSSGDFEGFGIAVIEANYFGLPAIGSKNSGIEDAINKGVSGITVDPDNPMEISEAINTITKNYSGFSEGAKKWAMQHHWSNIVLRYIEAIDSIVDS